MPEARNNGSETAPTNQPSETAPTKRRRLRPALTETEAEEATGFRFHGPRILLLLLLAVATYLLFPASVAPDLPRPEVGGVPGQDVIATVDFDVPKSSGVLQRERSEAAAQVEPVFVYDTTVVDSVRIRVNALMDRIDGAFEPDLAEAETIARLQSAYATVRMQAPVEDVSLLRAAANRNMLRNSLLTAVNGELAEGVALASDFNRKPTTQIRYVMGDSDFLVLKDSIATEVRWRDDASRRLPARAPARLVELQRLLLIRLFRPTILYDHDQTTASEDLARNAVESVKARYVTGERVLTAHERVGTEDIERLDAYEAKLTELGQIVPGPGRWLRIGGMILLNTLILLIFGLLLRLYRPNVYRSPRSLWLLAFLLFTVIAVASVLPGAELSPALVPIAFPALVAAMLWDGRLALTFALVIAILLTMQAPFGELSPRVMLILAGAAAALSVRAVHSRAHGLILGAVVAGAYLLASLGAGLLLGWEFSRIATTTLLGTANGLAAALIAVGLMPVFEKWTGITTDQTLLELGDLNRPLLKRLSLEAAGTYAHSINVANLGEAAARAIGANPLLARVGAYYHDIGKIAEPEYFVENQARGSNPHDEMPPQQSATIVRRHVTEGLRLAEEANLPDRLKAFISEHHGRQLIGFFYEKARDAEGGQLDESAFRYPGPRPHSQETAILMLADSVESAAKVLEAQTPEAIRALVDRIVQAKLDRGELDEAPLTLRDLARIKNAFLSVLSGLFHHRLDYPAAVTAPLRSSAEEGSG